MSERGTYFDKVWDRRVVQRLPGDSALLFADRVVLYELLGAKAALDIEERFGGRLYDPQRIVAVTDHIAPAKDGDSAQQAQALRLWARRNGVRMYDIGEGGICHVVVGERGYVTPGTTVCCSDSHTCTLGAFGAIALGAGTTAIEGAMLGGALVVKRPKVMRVQVNGRLASGATAKDLALKVSQMLGFRGGVGYVLEYAGEAIEALTMEQRLTLCNMAIEAGATTGIIAADATTYDYLAAAGVDVTPDDALRADADARYDATLEIDASALGPMISWGTNPGESVPIDDAVPADADPAALAYMGLTAGQKLRGLAIDQAFIGSCTNARLSDLRAAAEVFRGRHVSVPTIVTPGSERVRRAAEREGLHEVFQDAGALWTHSTCGACCGLSMGVLAPQMRCASSSNRNFPGRMGEGGRVHLAAPVVVAASAVLGRLATADELEPALTEVHA
ncbi:MAG TPA: aconitase family protein [Candidatus Elarobacter sp.]|nr:aconitase family protein [Candidatus Elarobacter sp.]